MLASVALCGGSGATESALEARRRADSSVISTSLDTDSDRITSIWTSSGNIVSLSSQLQSSLEPWLSEQTFTIT